MASSKLALVLSGGGMGGAAHLGAIKALEEYGLKPDAVVGTSIGAFVGSVYASGATPDRMIAGWQAISRMQPKEVLDVDLTSIKQAVSKFDYRYVTGFLLGQVLMQMLTDNYAHIRSFPELAKLSPAERAPKNIKEFYAVAANLIDGRETIFCDSNGVALDADGLFEGRRLCNHVSFIDAVRASFSLPAIFIPHQIPYTNIDCPCATSSHNNGPGYHMYVDGSVKDDYPITIAAKLAKADKIIGINLTKAGSKVSMVLKGGLPEVQTRILQIIGDDQYEADRYDKDVAKADLLTIDPAIGEIGVFDMSMGDWLVERGYQAVEQYFSQRGLDRRLSREENLARLFPPVLVDHCPECGHHLQEPLDLGSDEQFVADLPPYVSPKNETAPQKKKPLFFTNWRWITFSLGLGVLFIVGGLQFWWIYRLSGEAQLGGLIFIGGGLVHVFTVLLATALIGSWLWALTKSLLQTKKSDDHINKQ